jgi:hypothetical protein
MKHGAFQNRDGRDKPGHDVRMDKQVKEKGPK